jgi:phage regulator Rha-like protein
VIKDIRIGIEHQNVEQSIEDILEKFDHLFAVNFHQGTQNGRQLLRLRRMIFEQSQEFNVLCQFSRTEASADE